jgi:hypothetical protein
MIPVAKTRASRLRRLMAWFTAEEITRHCGRCGERIRETHICLIDLTIADDPHRATMRRILTPNSRRDVN